MPSKPDYPLCRDGVPRVENPFGDRFAHERYSNTVPDGVNYEPCSGPVRQGERRKPDFSWFDKGQQQRLYDNGGIVYVDRRRPNSGRRKED